MDSWLVRAHVAAETPSNLAMRGTGTQKRVQLHNLDGQGVETFQLQPPVMRLPCVDYSPRDDSTWNAHSPSSCMRGQHGLQLGSTLHWQAEALRW